MNTPTRTMRLAAAALVGLAATAAAFAPAHAGQTATQTEVDTRATGSVTATDRDCDPRDPKAGIICRVTRGKPDAKYPSAPVNPAFGF
ncbi:MAG: hypothetical protein Kow0026_03210 [Oricola sp.]